MGGTNAGFDVATADPSLINADLAPTAPGERPRGA